MFLNILLALVVLLSISCNTDSNAAAKNVKSDTTLKMLTYGLGNREYYRAASVIAQKYGFQYHAVAGCVVSSELLDTVRKENEKVSAIIEQRFGKSWKSTFEAEVDTLRMLQSRVEEIVRKELYIVEKQEELAKEGNGLYFSIMPIDGKKMFSVKAYGWGNLHNESVLLVYYQLSVDLGKNLVMNLNSQVEEMFPESE